MSWRSRQNRKSIAVDRRSANLIAKNIFYNNFTFGFKLEDPVLEKLEIKFKDSDWPPKVAKLNF